MPDMLQRGMRWLGGKMRSNASSPVVYQLGNNTTSTLERVATISPSEKLLDDGTVVLSYQDADFTFTASDLVFSGNEYKPQRGDLILATIQGNDRKFEVTTDGPGDAWTWTDSSRTRLRVHANDIGAQ